MSHTLKPTWQTYETNNSSDVPEPIKKIYKAVLKENHVLVCERLDWAFPAAYKIGIYNRIMLQFMNIDSKIVGTEVNPADYEIATYIFHAGRIILCPLQKDESKE